MRVLLVADDLTGAADSAAAFARPSEPVQLVAAGTRDVELDRALDEANRTMSVLAIDTDTRDRTPGETAERLGHLLARPGVHEHRGWTVLKIDSLLRGPIAAAIEAMRNVGLADRIVCAPALPALGRTTVDGWQLLGGRPINEAVRDPRSYARSARVSEAVGLPTGSAHLTVHDARTDADLDRLIATLPSPPHEHRLLLVGSAGLAGALARRLDGVEPTSLSDSSPRDAATLVVSLSPSPIAQAQVEHLLAHRPDTVQICVTPTMDAASLAQQVTELDDARSRGAAVALLTVDAPPIVDLPAAARTRTELLTRVRRILDAAGAWPILVGNGGDATRCILEAHGTTVLQVRATEGAGAVWCRLVLRDGRSVELITKSGSFGGTDALSAAIASPATSPSTT